MTAVRDIAAIKAEIRAELDDLEVRLTAAGNRRKRPHAGDRLDALVFVGRDLDAVADAFDRVLGFDERDNSRADERGS